MTAIVNNYVPDTSHKVREQAQVWSSLQNQINRRHVIIKGNLTQPSQSSLNTGIIKYIIKSIS